MSPELPPTLEQQPDPVHFEGMRDAFANLRNKVGRIALIGILVASGTALVEVAYPATAHADSTDTALASYPYLSMGCEHPNAQGIYSATGPCTNYDWGTEHTTVLDDQTTIDPNTNYAYRNCTDWVAYRVNQVSGGTISVPTDLHNGGDWYSNAPTSEQSLTPAAGDAAVEPGTTSNPDGHVAFVESVNSVDPSNPDNDNITVSEYNHDTVGTGDERTGRAVDMGFTEFVDFGVHPSSGDASLPDFNGDGRADLAWDQDGALHLLARENNGQFNLAGTTTGIGANTWEGAGDFIGDGKAQVVIYNATAGTLVELQWNGSSWAWVNETTGIGNPDWVAVGD